MAATEVTPESRDAALETEETPETSWRDFPDSGRTVYERMLAIIDELPAIGKTQRNEQQKFMFRGHDDVMNALNPLLAKHGVFIVPNVLARETNTRATTRGSTMYEVNLHVEFTFYGAGGDSFTASGWGEGTDMGDKSTSKAMTMAFKYVVGQAFALATEEISDADATSPEETTTGAARGGRQTRQTGRTQHETFDPARNLLPTAIEVKSADDAVAIRSGQRDLDPAQDWPAIEEFLAVSTFGKGLDGLGIPETGEYWRRLANAVAKVNEIAGPGDFPPPSYDQIREGYAWAFNGLTLALTEPEPVVTDEPAAEATEAAAE